MAISPIQPLKPVATITSVEPTKSSDGASFKETIKSAIGEVNNLQQEADKAAVKLATGDVEDVHQAMLAMQKAKLALDMTIQVRNKVVEAYQEIMRMQI